MPYPRNRISAQSLLLFPIHHFQVRLRFCTKNDRGNPVIDLTRPFANPFDRKSPSSSTEVFRRLAAIFSNSLRLMPGGETGKRCYFTRWQRAFFEKSSFFLRNRGDPGTEAEEPTGPILLNPLEYDDFALTSYADFCKLREQGIIAPGIRLQVCLSTPVNVIIGHVHPRYQVEVEVSYERALLTALRLIQDSIPKEDLAIQWMLLWSLP